MVLIHLLVIHCITKWLHCVEDSTVRQIYGNFAGVRLGNKFEKDLKYTSRSKCQNNFSIVLDLHIVPVLYMKEHSRKEVLDCFVTLYI